MRIEKNPENTSPLSKILEGGTFGLDGEVFIKTDCIHHSRTKVLCVLLSTGSTCYFDNDILVVPTHHYVTE